MSDSLAAAAAVRARSAFRESFGVRAGWHSHSPQSAADGDGDHDNDADGRRHNEDPFEPGESTGNTEKEEQANEPHGLQQRVQASGSRQPPVCPRDDDVDDGDHDASGVVDDDDDDNDPDHAKDYVYDYADDDDDDDPLDSGSDLINSSDDDEDSGMLRAVQDLRNETRLEAALAKRQAAEARKVGV